MADLFNAGVGSLGHPTPGSLSDNLRVAASRGNIQAVKDLLINGAGLEPDKDGRNALHYAAQEGHAEICKYLAAHGCDVDKQDVMGYTPLLRSASQGALETVQMLLDAGCSTDIQDEHGNAAIHECCWNGFSKTAELLVKYSCNVCLTNKAGFTALHLSAQNGHNECSRVLLYAGCNPDLQNNYGDTALHTAARYGHAGVTRILISAKCKLSEQNKNGDTALHISAALKRRKIAKILVESGIDTELLNKQNEKAVEVARRKEHPEIILIITSYSRPRASSSQRQRRDNFGVTFKEAVDVEDKLEVCHIDEPPNKQQPKADKQEKERRFFFFKKKKKEKEKVPPPPPSQTPPAITNNKKNEVENTHVCHGKPAVHGFFSQYVPRDGMQLYRDLAGNIKQGPIGYAPVCQCGPSLKRLEHRITNTHDTLHNQIDASHNILSQRIDNLDCQTKQQLHSTEVMIQERFINERNACHSRISERLQEEKLETQVMFENTNADMKEELEYWLNDKLASYGHCLDHHHDDSALPPRNLFLDFPTMGRLVRSRSDETLSASDYSGKFRKRDFYASRQAAMQQIRGWDVPVGDSLNNQDRSRKRERNNNVISMSNKVVTHAQVHFSDSERMRPDKNQVSSSVATLSPSINVDATRRQSTGNAGIMSRSAITSRKQSTDRISQMNLYKRQASQPRVTFSNDQLEQHFQQPYQQQTEQHFQQTHRYHQHSRVSSPPPSGSQRSIVSSNSTPFSKQNVRNFTHTSPVPHNNIQQQTASPTTQHSRSSRQNLLEGGPPRTDMRSGELGDSRISRLHGQEMNCFRNVQQNTTRFQNGFDLYSDRTKTLSADSLFNEEINLSYPKDIVRCQSVENALEERDFKREDNYNSGYMTDSALKSYSSRSQSQNIYESRNVRSTHSVSPASRATFRYRLPETSANSDFNKPEQAISALNSLQENLHLQSRHLSSQPQSLAGNTHIKNNVDSGKKVVPTKTSDTSSKDVSFTKTAQKSMNGLSDDPSAHGSGTFGKSDRTINPERSDSVNRSDEKFQTSKTHSVHFTPPMKECLQHEALISGNTVPSPPYATGNKEDSTCSSNQDSGYSSRNHAGGLRRGVGTSGGTPSSSFSLERSSCNTPSNVDTPYTNHGEVSNSGIRGNYPPSVNAHITNYNHPFSSNLFSKNVQSFSNEPLANLSPDKRASSEKNVHGFLETYNVNNNSTVPFGKLSSDNCAIKSFDSYHASNSIYSRPELILSTSVSDMTNLQPKCISQTNNSNKFSNNAFYINKSHSPAENQLQDGTKESEKQSYDLKVNRRPSVQMNYFNNQAYDETNSVGFQQGQNKQGYKSMQQQDDDTSVSQQTHQSALNNSYKPSISQGTTVYGQQQTINSTSQSAVQSHIQSWYQRKLMEAAQRLKQNYNSTQQSYDHQTVRNDCLNTRSDVGRNQRQDSYNRTNELNHSPNNNEQPYWSSSSHLNSQTKPLTVNTSSLQQNSNFYSQPDQWTQHRQEGYLQSFAVPENYDHQSVTSHYKEDNTRRSSAYESNFTSINNMPYNSISNQPYRTKASSNNIYPASVQMRTHNTANFNLFQGSDV